MRHYGAITCGLSSKWWSEKHNLHHAFTNVVGVDEDIMVREKEREKGRQEGRRGWKREWNGERKANEWGGEM